MLLKGCKITYIHLFLELLRMKHFHLPHTLLTSQYTARTTALNASIESPRGTPFTSSLSKKLIFSTKKKLEEVLFSYTKTLLDRLNWKDKQSSTSNSHKESIRAGSKQLSELMGLTKKRHKMNTWLRKRE